MFRLQSFICEKWHSSIWNHTEHRRQIATIEWSQSIFFGIDRPKHLADVPILELVCHRHTSARQIKRISCTLWCHTSQSTGEKASKSRIFRSVDVQQSSVLFESGELHRRVWDDACESRCVAAIKCKESFASISSLDESQRVPEWILNVFAENRKENKQH